MVYNPKDFKYLKPKNNSYLQTFKSVAKRNYSSNKPRQQSVLKKKPGNKSLWSILWSHVKEYCNNSSLHCLSYIFNEKLNCYEKLIWLVILVTTSVTCIIVYCDLAELYNSQRLQTTVSDTLHPVFVVPFPSVGVCLKNRIDWPRLRSNAAKRFLPPNVDDATLQTFYRFFEDLADFKLHNLRRLAPLLNATATDVNLSLIENVDVLAVMNYLTFPCTEVFSTHCFWRLKSYNCCEIFTLERTEFGFCYVFNSAVSEEAQKRAKIDKFYPYHNSYSGESTGLDFEVILNENRQQPGLKVINGLYIMIKQPDQWHADVKFVNQNTFTKLSITAELTETDNRIRLVTPIARGCIFDDETNHPLYKKIPGLFYWRGNCITRCHQEYVLKYCKCNLNLLFPDTKSDNFTSCKPPDFKCIYEHAKLFNRERHIFESKYIDEVDNEIMTCNCLNSCKQLFYHAFYSSFPLEGANTSDPIKKVRLDIHFQTPYILKYSTSVRYTFVELLANFGGIIGLFLGASLLSGIELLYHFTIGLYIRSNKPLHDKYCKKLASLYKRHSKAKVVKISTIEPRNFYKY